MSESETLTCEHCGNDLTAPYAVEYTDTEYVHYRARVSFIEGKARISEEMDGSDYVGTKDRGVPECGECGTPVPVDRD